MKGSLSQSDVLVSNFPLKKKTTSQMWQSISLLLGLWRGLAGACWDLDSFLLAGGKLGLKKPQFSIYIPGCQMLLSVLHGANPFCISLIFRAFSTFWRAKPVDNPSKWLFPWIEIGQGKLSDKQNNPFCAFPSSNLLCTPNKHSQAA